MDCFEKDGGLRAEAVISVFVSRFDRMLDAELANKGIDVAKTGIYNAAKVYNLIEANNTPSVRTLFASTGVKGDDLPADYYMKELLAPHSVNTAPLATIESFIAQEATEPNLPIDNSEIDAYFAQLAENGFNMDAIYEQLLNEGLEAFENAFQEMLDTLN